MNTIENNINQIKSKIDAAANRVGRDPSEITLVAVSKRNPSQAIRQAYEAGQRDFGENYAQELRDKAKELAGLSDIRWHFIGNLQRNKVKYVSPCVDLMETVDSEKLIAELSKQAAKHERIIRVLVQVNVGEEEQKSGCSVGEAPYLIDEVEKAPGLELAGLMTIPPWDLEPEQTRVHFKALAALREKLGGKERLPHLSMGMSHDFEVAIEEGATYVRVGTAIFGERAPK